MASRPGGRGAALRMMAQKKHREEKAEGDSPVGAAVKEEKPEPPKTEEPVKAAIEADEKPPKSEEITTTEEKSEKKETPEKAKDADDVAQEAKAKSRPARKEPGTKGRAIDLVTNYLALDIMDDCGIFEYKVKTEPVLDHLTKLYYCIHQQTEVLGNSRLFNGVQLILPKKLPDEKTVLKSTDQDGQKIDVIIDFVKEKKFRDQECIRLFNVLLNRSFKALNLFPFKMPGGGTQKCYYDPVNKNTLEKQKLDIWPGYVSSIDIYNGGVYLLFDVSSKIIRKETAGDILVDAVKKDPKNYKDAVLKALLGKSIITRYNNKSYRIDDIDFESNPSNTFTTEHGQTHTFVDYYKKQYGVEVRDLKQPLLVNYVKRSQLPDPIRICLIPELCFVAGLTENQRSDFRVMSEVAKFTRLKPSVRQDVYKKFVKSLVENKTARQFWTDWGLEISSQNLKIVGRTLPNVTLHFGQNHKELVGPKGDWTRASTNRTVLTAANVERWAIVYPVSAKSTATAFMTILKQQAPRMGVNFKAPKIVEIPNDRTDTFVKAIRDLPDNAEFVLTMFTGPQKGDRYAAVKKICLVDRPMASQVVMQKTLANEKRQLAVVQKVVLQINCKMGGSLWGTRIPIKGLMVVGIDVYKNKGGKKEMVVGIVGSINATFSQFFSDVIITERRDNDLYKQISQGVVGAIEAFREANGSLPEKVLMYRDGVNSGQYDMARSEALTVETEIDTAFKEESIKLAYVVVQKRVTTKLLYVQNWAKGEMDNPPAGTVVDTMVTSIKWYDFYLIPMNVMLGTITPTHFTVVHDACQFEADTLQQISYVLTHMYFNWAGNVKVPAVCQYSHKLVELVGEHLHKIPNSQLNKTLYYL